MKPNRFDETEQRILLMCAALEGSWELWELELKEEDA